VIVAKARSVNGPPQVIEAVREWVTGGREDPERLKGNALEQYFHGIAEARYVVRKIFRVVDEQAKAVGLEPLEHQALIQVLGAVKPMRVIDLAERLDIAPAFASRLVKQLEDRDLVVRSDSVEDRRSKHLSPTPRTRVLLAEIDERVHLHVEYLQRQLSDYERVAALGIFAFYLGASPRAAELEAMVRHAAAG
jgi:DNA-binding MarR family transcriptional regulator